MSRLLGSGEAVITKPPDPRPARRPEVDDQAPDGPGEGLPDSDLQWQEIPSTRPDLSRTLPRDVALLKVMPVRVEGEDCFRLEIYARHRLLVTDDPETLRRQRRPGMVLADELRGQVSDSDVVRYYTMLRNWSDTKYELTQWLAELRREAGTTLRLVVWDDTDFGIPWELFWHAMEAAPGWLGTVVQVIRWTTVHDARRHGQFSAEEAESLSTEVLCYEDPALTGRASIHGPAEPGYTATRTMEDLLRELAGPDKYGLVYVRGHGVHSRDLFQATLAGVSLADLAGRPLPALGRAKSVVFLNACNSARPVIDQSFGDESNRNFAEIFLRQRASSVIATMAEVPVGHSAVLARKLIDQARSDGIKVPEFLRAHRQRYAARLPPHAMNLTEAQQSAVRAFLYASVFAYFGHPDSVLTLAEP